MIHKKESIQIMMHHKESIRIMMHQNGSIIQHMVGFDHTLGQSVSFVSKKGGRLTGDWIMPPFLPWAPSLGYFRKTNPQNPGINRYGSNVL